MPCHGEYSLISQFVDISLISLINNSSDLHLLILPRGPLQKESGERKQSKGQITVPSPVSSDLSLADGRLECLLSALLLASHWCQSVTTWDPGNSWTTSSW